MNHRPLPRKASVDTRSMALALTVGLAIGAAAGWWLAR